MRTATKSKLLAMTAALVIGLQALPTYAQESDESGVAASTQQTVAATPPMGWNAWNAFRTDVDEARIMQMATLMVDLGLADAGYQYVNIDDGWAMRREADGNLEIRTNTFPSAALPNGETSFRPWVEKLHSMGLKAGVYTEIGRNTCAQIWDSSKPNQPEGSQLEREVGAYGFEEQDMNLFIQDWGFDYVKIDACGVADYGGENELVASDRFRPFPNFIYRGNPEASDRNAIEAMYARLSRAAREASEGLDPVISICAWGEADVSDWAGNYGNLWRTSGDISKTWNHVLGNFDSAAPRALFASPGRWNDPDMMEVGNGDFGADNLVAARSHFSLWSIIAAPLIMSVDLANASPGIVKILGNREVIAVNQDPAGNQGVILHHVGNQQVIAKHQSDGSKAVTLTNRGDGRERIAMSVAKFHLNPAAPLRARNLWTGRAVKIDNGEIVANLGPRETLMLRIEGQPLQPGIVHLAEMPARVRVTAEGYKPSNRSLANPWIPARLGYLPSGEPVMYDGQHDHDALATGEGVRLEIGLDREFSRFRAMPDQPGRILVLGDGKVLYSGDGETTVPIDVSVAGVTTLEISMPPATAKGLAPNVRVLFGVELHK